MSSSADGVGASGGAGDAGLTVAEGGGAEVSGGTAVGVNVGAAGVAALADGVEPIGA